MRFDGIIFDLDGTLWDSTEKIMQSWNIAAKSFEGLQNKNISLKQIQDVMGLPMDVIAERIFPELDSVEQKKMLNRCCEVENEYLAEQGGILYPEVENTLMKLSENHKLFIVSNGQDGYIQAFLKAHNLQKYFTDFESWGNNKVPKGENNKLVIERNNLKNAVYVGDTQGDADSAAVASIPFVYARYGFGNVQKYDYVIDTFSQLSEIIQ